MPHRRSPFPLIIPLMAPLLLATCGGPSDQRLAEMAQQSVQQQAKQNEQMAEQGRQVATAAKELVAADAKARADALQMQRELAEREAQSRQALDRQRDDLEQERKQIAGERHREPILAAVITTFGLLLASLLPLILCGYVLHGLRSRTDEDEAAVCELLINELASEQSPLLTVNSPPRALEHKPIPDVPSLPNESNGAGSDDSASSTVA